MIIIETKKLLDWQIMTVEGIKTRINWYRPPELSTIRGAVPTELARSKGREKHKLWTQHTPETEQPARRWGHRPHAAKERTNTRPGAASACLPRLQGGGAGQCGGSGNKRNDWSEWEASHLRKGECNALSAGASVTPHTGGVGGWAEKAKLKIEKRKGSLHL